MARALCGGSISSSHRATWPAACSDTTSFRRASCRDRCALVHIFPSLRSQADHPLTRNQMGIRRRGALKQALRTQRRAHQATQHGQQCPPADASTITAIYNQGIADRVATFETEPRSPEDIASWFTSGRLIMVAEGTQGVIAFAASFPYSTRPCYAGVNEFSVYVARDCRGTGAGRVVLTALIEAANAYGLHKLTSRVFRKMSPAGRCSKNRASWKSVFIAARQNSTGIGAIASLSRF